MTDDTRGRRERAVQRYILCSNLGTVAQAGLNMTTLQSGTVVVLYDDHVKALAEAERRGMERAVKANCMYCNDDAWTERNADDDHISPYTGIAFSCASRKIRQALAGEEASNG